MVLLLQVAVRDEFGYFIYGFGLEPYTAWAADRKAKKLNRMTEEEKKLAESYCKDAKDVTPEYSSTSRLFDQIVFIAPLFRLSENQTMAGGKSYTYYFTPEVPALLMRCGHAVELAPVRRFGKRNEPGAKYSKSSAGAMQKALRR